MDTTEVETADGLTLQVAHHTPSAPSTGTVLLAHGLTQDMDEGGMFTRLADRLCDAGFAVVRFTYRGHGNSDGTDHGMTVAGELLDFETAFEHTTAAFPGPYFVAAKSFGAVSTCLSLDRYDDHLAGVVLWNPVLDIGGTFLDPTLPWGQENFTGEQLTTLRETGTLSIDGEFEMGRVLYEELHHYDPGARFRESDVPALVIHGDADGIVPYEDVRRVVAATDAEFYTIEDANHGFLRPDEQPPYTSDAREQDRVTVDWLTAQVES